MINLLPFEIREERIYGRRNRVLFGVVISLFVSAGLVLTIMLGGIALVSSEEDSLRSEIETNDQQVLRLESEIKDVGSVATRLNAAEKLFRLLRQLCITSRAPMIAAPSRVYSTKSLANRLSVPSRRIAKSALASPFTSMSNMV